MGAKPRLRLYPEQPLTIGGAYESSARHDAAIASWQPGVRSADGDTLADKHLVDSRARDAKREDAYVAAGAQMHRDSIVGSMYMLNCKPRVRSLGLDEMWAQEFQEEVEGLFGLWAESLDCWVDASRRNTFTSLVRLAVGSFLMTGETLATAEWARDDMRPYRTSIQMVDPARLSNPYHMANATDRARGGVRLSASGAPIGYYIRRELQGGHFFGLREARDSWRWSYVRARNSMGRPQVIHIVEQDRPGQTRGISQLAAALKEMRILKRFRDVELQAAALRASWAASITSELPSDVVFQMVGAGGADASSDALLGFTEAYLGAVSEYTDNAKNLAVDGVKIPHLLPGTKLDFNQMGAPEGQGSDFESAVLRNMASAFNVSFEQFSKDYRETNYSSARAGMLETQKFMRGRKKLCADRFATMVFRLWFEEAVNAGHIRTMMASSVPNIYDGMNMDAFTRSEWIGAGFGQIDELKETQAMVARIESGVSTYEHEIARLGGDWRDVFAQRRREKDVLEELDLMPEPEEGMDGGGNDEGGGDD